MLQQFKADSTRKFTTDVFTIPYKDGYILYIPEVQLVAGVDSGVFKIVQAIKQHQPLEDNMQNREFLTAMQKLGVFQPRPIRNTVPQGKFLPTHVTLSLTSRCNLKCIYCYARAGERIADMDENLLDAALRFVVSNAIEKNEKELIVSFHGEGEPTANSKLFEKAVRKSTKIAKENGLKVRFTMSTNGMWGTSARDVIADNFKNLSVSLDGPPEIQNAQRPTVSGTPSFPIIMKNLQFIETKGVEYGLRVTVLPEGIGSMLPFLNMVSDSLKCNWVHFEPVFLTGRAVDMHCEDNSQETFFRRFVDEYHHAVSRGYELGIRIAYSGCRGSHYTPNFCNVTGPELNFFVSTKGIVSSCYEIIDPETPKGKFTVYGRYDRIKGKFVFDNRRLNTLRTFDVSKMKHCKDCFAKWNCSGDCFARSDIHLSVNGAVTASRESPRCYANRETTLRELVLNGLASDVMDRESIRSPTERR
ncbi:radical SAM protein [bacterium]|nr:MAG: radical SAM protein [bacterium]